MSIRRLRMPASAYRTYQVASPLSTHYRAATCAEIDCSDYKQGWMVPKLAVTDELMHIIKQLKYKYTTDDLGFLIFEAGQRCFRASTHTISLERPEIYRVGRGRGFAYNPRQALTHDNAANWVDDFATHQDKLKREFDKG